MDRIVTSFRELDVSGVALHRGAERDEVRALAALARRVPIVAVFGNKPGFAPPLVVVDGVIAADDREQSLDAFCRSLHAMRDVRIAVRCGPEPDGHPSPDEIEWIADAVRHVGYWHDVARADESYLEAAGNRLFGASFHPLEYAALRSLRAALPSGAPAVVSCPTGTSRTEVLEAWRCARGEFRA